MIYNYKLIKKQMSKKANFKLDSGANHNVVKVLGIGAIAAAAAGAYFLYGTKEGAKKRTAIKGWMLKAKGEVLEKLEGLKDVSEENYNTILESVLNKYSSLKNIDKSDVDELVIDLKKHWKNIKKHLNEPTKKVKKITSAKK